MSARAEGDVIGEPCAFCGCVHPPGPVGDVSTFFASIEIKIKCCPNLPPTCIYVDQEYERGPRGALFRVVADD